jgi:regulator of sigma E protease
LDVPIRIGPLRLPRTLGKFQWGETEYGIGIIPLGGYVKMLGQDDNPANAQKEAERIRVRKTAGQEADSFTADAPDTTGSEQYELDPRSFPAKSVPQRMAIISAGVIMNLIFAVIFGAIAYGVGVKYLPSEISGTTPGSPAWVEDVPTGATIVQLGQSGEENQHLRFDWDLRQYVAYAGMNDDPQPIKMRLQKPDGQDLWVSLPPDMRMVRLGEEDFATIGVRSTGSTTLSKSMPALPGSAAEQATPPFEPGDKIIGLDGRLFDTSRANEKGDLPAYELEAALARNLDQPLTFDVQRADKSSGAESLTQTLTITVPPNPMKCLGVEPRMGPIEAVRKGSPAEEAGFQVGDVITRVQGAEVGDPMVLPQRFRPWIGQEVRISVRRPQGEQHEEVELVVRPEDRFQFVPATTPGGLVGIEPIGVAYSVENTLVGVQPDSPAAQAGMQAGDQLLEVRFVPSTDDAKKLAKELFGRTLERAIEFGPTKKNWPYVFWLLQNMPAGIDVELKYTRGEQEMTAQLQPVKSSQWFWEDRGIQTSALYRIHTAASWSEAWHLGFRETKESLFRVFDVLGKLVTFQLSPKNLGGPLMIAAVAGSEASQGIPRLLIFLTFLSANLAILNFLPIPALDGGHIVFLAAEAVTGKPVDERLQGTLTLIGVAALLGLMLFVFANDIGRLFL